MKNTILFLVFLLCNYSLSAQDVKEVFSSSKTMIEFVGLDFSQAKMVGSDGFNNPSKIHSYYFRAWNGLFLSESEKYDVRGAFMKTAMDYDTEVVEKGNEEVDFLEMITNKTPKDFSDEIIQNAISKYDTKEMQADFGLTFLVHSFNKFQEKAHIYVVIFDAKSKKVLFSDKMEGEAGGFGFRNYWARSVYNVIDEIKDRQFRKWKRELNKKTG